MQQDVEGLLGLETGDVADVEILEILTETVNDPESSLYADHRG
jgi:hypothetical protein